MIKRRLEVCAVLALLLIIETGCVQVFDISSENKTTTVEPLKEPEYMKASLSSPTISSESLKEEKARNIEANDDYRITTSTTTPTTTTHRIPPTLLNTKVEFNGETSEKPGKSLKDLA